MDYNKIYHLILLLVTKIYKTTQVELLSGKQEIKRNHLLTTIPKLLTDYSISFEVKANTFRGGSSNILHLTSTDKSCCEVGDRVVGVWFENSTSTATRNRLLICSYVNNQANYCQHSSHEVLIRRWSEVRIRQQKSPKMYRYWVSVNGMSSRHTFFYNAREFTSVKVYTSNPWDNPADARIRLLTINGADFREKNERNKIMDLTTTSRPTAPPHRAQEPSSNFIQKVVHQKDRNAQIHCNVDDTSNYYINWYFEGEEVESTFIDTMDDCQHASGTFRMRSRPQTLVICQMDFTVHQGIYACRIQIEDEFVYKTTKLIILAKPTKPELPKEVYVKYNSWKVVSCSVLSFPKASISWYKSLMDVSLSNKTIRRQRKLNEMTSRLNLTWLRGGDGEYSCHAENQEGISRAYMEVKFGPEPTKTERMESKMSNKRNQWVIVALGCSFGTFTVLFTVVTYHQRHKERKKWRFAPELEPSAGFELDPTRTIQEQASELPYDVNWEFPRSDVLLGQLIGAGNFGQVWEALVEGIHAFNPLDTREVSVKSKLANIHKRNPKNDFFVKYFRKQNYPPKYSQRETVAIKCLKENWNQQDYSDLASELKMMIQIGKHKNIVNLLGACTLNGPLWLILEFCPNGDLLKFIRKRRKLFRAQWDVDEAPPGTLYLLDLMKMAIGISEAMCFLSSRSIVHRDLSARNVLVGQDMEVKVADFGMARDMTKYGEYNMESDDAVPVRWLAPESLSYGQFSTSSDVWAYGILLWEIFSLGVRPYPGIANQEIIHFLQSGKRLSPPEHCPNNVAEAMTKCWNERPEDRPTFEWLMERLSDIVLHAFAPDCNYYSGSKAFDQTYTQVDCVDFSKDQKIMQEKLCDDSSIDKKIDEMLGTKFQDLNQYMTKITMC